MGAFEVVGIRRHDVYDEQGYFSVEALSNPDASRLAWFYSILTSNQLDISELILLLQVELLASSQNLVAGIQLPLPLNQWQVDMTHIWATSQTYLKNIFIETARGLSDLALTSHRMPPSNHAQQQMCHNQVRTTTMPADLLTLVGYDEKPC